MSYFLDPTGQPTYGIGICARCSKKFFLTDLYSDPNAPGLMVCRDDLDDLDPWRLPARQTENISLPFARPDVPLTGTQQADFYFLLTEAGENILTESGLPIEVELDGTIWLIGVTLYDVLGTEELGSMEVED